MVEERAFAAEVFPHPPSSPKSTLLSHSLFASLARCAKQHKLREKCERLSHGDAREAHAPNGGPWREKERETETKKRERKETGIGEN